MRLWRRPTLATRARRLVRDGRRALQAGHRAEATALFAAAMRLDPTVACEPWGLVPVLEAEGRGIVRERMQERLNSWYGPTPSPLHQPLTRLSNKAAMRNYIAAAGIPLPHLYDKAPDVTALNWTQIPDRVVIKPTTTANRNGVVLAEDGYDHVAGQTITPNLPSYAEAFHRDSFDTLPPVLAEEFIIDVDHATDPALLIPRDYKVFVVGGMAVYMWVFDRNAPDGRRDMAILDRNGRAYPQARVGWPDAPPRPLPQGFGAMIEMAEQISHHLPWLMRVDFYLTARGPVFGEFTTFPNAGLKLKPFGRRTYLQMWEIWPDDRPGPGTGP